MILWLVPQAKDLVFGMTKLPIFAVMKHPNFYVYANFDG